MEYSGIFNTIWNNINFQWLHGSMGIVMHYFCLLMVIGKAVRHSRPELTPGTATARNVGPNDDVVVSRHGYWVLSIRIAWFSLIGDVLLSIVCEQRRRKCTKHFMHQWPPTMGIADVYDKWESGLRKKRTVYSIYDVQSRKAITQNQPQ
jgi:hypothetical protein